MPTDLTGDPLDLSPLGPEATEADRNAKINAILRLARPLHNITGINGLRTHLSDSNLVIEVDPNGGDDVGGATTNDSGDVATPDPGSGSSGGGTPDPSDPGEPFTPGDANTPGAAVAYEVRARGGTASLIGFSEFTSPSTPAKKYLTLTLSGTASGTAYSDNACAVSDSGVVFNQSTAWHPEITSTVQLTQTGSTIFWQISHVSTYNLIGNYQVTVNGSTAATYPGTVNGEPYNTTQSGSATLLAGQTISVLGLSYTRPTVVAESLAYSGTFTYNATTGATTAAGAATGNLLDTGTGALAAVSATSLSSVDDADTRLGSGNFTTSVDTALTHSRIKSGSCVQIGSSSYYRKLTTCTLKDTLSAEDTDNNAIARLLAGAGGTWGTWGAAGSLASSAAIYDARTTGFTFDYGQSQLRANYTGMPAGWPFKVRVRIAKVNHATSAVSTVSTLLFNPTAFGDGTASWTVDVVPAEPGTTYKVQSVAHFL